MWITKVSMSTAFKLYVWQKLNTKLTCVFILVHFSLTQRAGFDESELRVRVIDTIIRLFFKYSYCQHRFWSVSSTSFPHAFAGTRIVILLLLPSGFNLSSHLWKATYRYPNGPIGYWKKATIWKEACIVRVKAVIHNYQGGGASWSRKCLWWKDCPGDLTSFNTDNVNFCARSRPYQREASQPSGPDRFCFRVF